MMTDELKVECPRWMFMSIVGSQNYGTAIPGSDTDVKVAYLPTFEEFYRGRFKHADTGSPVGDDYTIHPAHEFLKHAFKGNMNFWEVFFSDSFDVNWKLWEHSGEMRMFFQFVRKAIVLNAHPNFCSMRGMAAQKHNEAIRCHGRGDGDLVVWKPAQHSMRMLDTILAYNSTGNLHLDLSTIGIYDWFNWRGDQRSVDFDQYLETYAKTLTSVDALEDVFRAHQSEGEVRSWREKYMGDIDRIMMDMILRKSKDK
jgi:hypothetical protein